jgi:cell division protein FtsL
MKKTLFILIIIAIVVVAAKMTVPTPEKHREVAMERLTEMVNEKISTIEGAKEIIEGNNIDTKLFIKLALTQLQMKDYFVCNAGYIKYDGDDYMLTLGLFGHVFVMTDYIDEVQQAQEKIEEYKNKF